MRTQRVETATPMADDLVIACVTDAQSFSVGRADGTPQLQAESFDLALHCARAFGRRMRVDVWHIDREAVLTRVAHFR